MKVLITNEWYAPVINGVVTSLVNLENELLKLGHEVRVLTLSETRHSHKDGRISYIASVKAAWIYPNARLSCTAQNKLIDELIAWKPDVIHTQAEFSTFFMARHIAKKTGAPIVHTYHTVYEKYTHYFFPNKRIGKSIAVVFSRFVLKRTDHIIAPTLKVQNMLLGYRVKRPISVVPTGIVLDRFTEPKDPQRLAEIKKNLLIEQDRTLLVYLGRLAKEKNVEEILDFIKTLHDPRLVLLIVGGGPYLKNLRHHVKLLGIESAVRFSGMVTPEEVPYYYAVGDLFVSASQSETQGLTYVEALAAGLPALCKKDACLDGVITDNENGWQYATEAEFQQRLHDFITHPELRARLSQNARAIAVRDFSAENFARQVIVLYEQALSEKKVTKQA